jgi:hypothetical protein
MLPKVAFLLLRHLLTKVLLKKFTIWKFLSPKKPSRQVSKIPVPKSVKEAQPRERSRPDSPSFRVPKSETRANSSRPTSAPPKRGKVNEDVGARLHNKAQEIEEKKEKIRKKLKVDYSFKPTLAENTNKWLNKSTRESHKNSHEEIAVVSSAAVLNLPRNGATETKVKPFIMSRADFKYVNVEVKENYFK